MKRKKMRAKLLMLSVKSFFLVFNLAILDLLLASVQLRDLEEKKIE